MEWSEWSAIFVGFCYGLIAAYGFLYLVSKYSK